MADFSTLYIYTDGGSRGNPGPAGIGVYAVSADQTEISTLNHQLQSQLTSQFEWSEYIGEATNNEAEYTAFLKAMMWLRDTFIAQWMVSHAEMNPTPLAVHCFLDSKLVVEQLNKNWKIKDARMRTYAEQIWPIMADVKQSGVTITISHVPREDNFEADRLVNQALDAALV